MRIQVSIALLCAIMGLVAIAADPFVPFDEIPLTERLPLNAQLSVGEDGVLCVNGQPRYLAATIFYDAWIDRGLNKDNDIDDMMYLIDNFYLVNCTDDCYGEVFDAVEDADIFVSGAYMIAMDVARLLTDDEKRYYKAYLDGELAKQETSSLLQKSMDASGQEYKVVVRSWQMFSDRIMRS